MKICPVKSYNHPFVYLSVRDYLGVDMDGMIGIPLDELVQGVAKEVIEEMNDANREMFDESISSLSGLRKR